MTPADPRRARQLSEQLGLRQLTGQLMVNRGIRSEEEARRFLDPKLSDLRPPEGALPMAGFTTAVERLRAAVVGRETIGVFGDYDVDGVTTCALLSDFLTRAGATVIPRVARRGDGYGFGQNDARDLIAGGCSIIITGDCGTSDHETLALCRVLGLDVIVVDHHQVPERPPDALALLNPHQPGCAFPFKGLASVGVAFYLAAVLRTRLKTAGWPHLPDLHDLLDLVAVGTVADLAPLTAENRVLVSAGLKALVRGRRPGLRVLGELGGLADGVVQSAGDIAFRIAPRLNAPGRLGDAQEALLTLLEMDHRKARGHAEQCHEMNIRRQEVQEGVLREAREQVEALLHEGPQEVLVVAGQGWHAGVVGIVAAKLVDLYGAPSVVIALDGEVGRGSARTAHGFHLYNGLRQAASLLLRYGGHAAAAGLSLSADQLPLLRRALCAAFREQLGGEPRRRSLNVDATVSLDEVDEHFTRELARLEPFGIGNPEPTLLVRDAELFRLRVVGSGHLQVRLRMGSHIRDGIGFGLGARGEGLSSGSRVQVAFVPEMDTYRGTRRVRLRLRELLQADLTELPQPQVRAS